MSSILADLSISVASKQYVRVPIADVNGNDPTSDGVQMAFPTPGVDPVTFYTGSWSTLSGIYYARCLVGPGGAVALGVGYYDVYVKVSDSPEVPVLFAGTLEVI